MILGLAYDWDDRKGLNFFIELSKNLSDDYIIVLVGTNERIDSLLPNKIISIHKTNKIDELVDIYSSADLFVNPTLEDNFPTVNIESLACGTPVLTFDTGGSPEIIDDTCGAVINKCDLLSLLDKISELSKKNIYSSDNCVKRAKAFDTNTKYDEYLKLYEE